MSSQYKEQLLGLFEDIRRSFRSRSSSQNSVHYQFIPKLGKENPLNNPYILEIIFGYLCVEDLKACTLVSRTWYYDAIKFLKEKSVITIDNPQTLKKYMAKVLPLRRHQQENVNNPFSIAPTLPVNLRACKIIFNQNMSIRNNSSITDFIVEHGECIETLSIDLGGPSYANTQLRLILQSVNLTHLHKLILVVPVFSGYAINYDISPLVTVQELQVLQYYGSSDLSNRQNNLDKIYTALPNLSKVSGLPMEFLIFSSASPPLQDLDCELKLLKHDLDGFSDKMFPLRKLSVARGGGRGEYPICNWIPETKKETFIEILSNCVQTLEELTLTNIDVGYGVEDVSLEFLNLESLTLHMCSRTLAYDESLAGFPNLKSLKITGNNFEQMLDFAWTSSMSGIDKLEWESVVPFSSSQIERIFWCFPTLKFLKVDLEGLGNEGVQEILQHASELEVLILGSRQLTDMGLTTKDGLISLGSLAHLREIQLHSEHLTEASILSALLECKNLQTIGIRCTKISANSIEKLTERFNLENLRVTLPDSETMSFSQAKNVLEKMRGRKLVINNQIAPSRDLDRQKIKDFLILISNSNSRRNQ